MSVMDTINRQREKGRKSPPSGSAGGDNAPPPTAPAPGAAPTQQPAAPAAAPSGSPAGEAQPQDGGYDLFDFLGSNYAGIRTVSPLKYFGDYGDFLVEQGVDSAGQAALAGGVDYGSMATMDAVSAADYAMRKSLNKEDFGNFWEFYGDRKEEINLALQEAQNDHELAYNVGAAASGAVGTGVLGLLAKGAIKGGNAAMRWWGTTLGASAGAGGEAAIYRVNSDGTLSEAASDAAMASLGTALLTPVSMAAGKGLSKVFGRDTNKAKQVVAEEVLQAMRNASGNPRLSPEDAVAAINERGPDAVLGDIYPEMRPFFTSARIAGDKQVVSNLHNLVRARNRVEGDLRPFIQKVISTPRAVNPDEHRIWSNQLRKRLSGRYNQLFDKHNGVMDLQNAMDSIDKLFKLDVDTPKLLEDAVDELKKGLNEFQAYGPDGKAIGGVTLKQFHELKKKFGDKLGQLSTRSDVGDANKQGYFEAKRVYDYMDDVLSERIPGYERLAKTYGATFRRNEAYEMGYDLMGKNQDITKKGIDFRMSNLATPGELNSFVNGVKARVIKDLSGEGGEGAIESLSKNTGYYERVATVLGRENLDKIINQSKEIVQMRAANAAMEKAKTAKPASPSGLLDKVTLGRISLETEGAAAKRAQQELLAGGSASAKELAAKGQQYGDVALATRDQVGPTIKKALATEAGDFGPESVQLGRYGGLGGAIAGGQAGETPELDEMYNQFYDYLAKTAQSGMERYGLSEPTPEEPPANNVMELIRRQRELGQ